MKKWLLLLIYLLLPLKGKAEDFVSLYSLDFSYGHFLHAKHPLFYRQPSQPDKNVILKPNVDLMYGYMFWDNKITTMTDEHQFKFVQWHYELGFRPFDWMKIHYTHTSSHLLDTNPITGTQNGDNIGLSIRLYGPKERGKSLW